MNTYPNSHQIVTQFLGLGIVFITIHFGLHIPILNLFLFWILPLFLAHYCYSILELIYRQKI
jgi:beta-carotene/zeaxanthin 4-ketolase